MGHVPAGEAAQEGAGHDVSRREHRRARAPRLQGARELGRFGERLAAAFLERRGVEIIAANRRVGHDEVDLIARHAGGIVAVEVKTRVAADPIEEFSDEQAARLRRAGQAIGTVRCDLITVRPGRRGVEIRWLRGVC